MSSTHDEANVSNVGSWDRHVQVCRDFLADSVSSDSTLVEIGSGDQPFGHLPGLVVHRRISLDNDPVVLRRACGGRGRMGAMLIAGDAEFIPVRAGTIDGVIAIFAFEHFPSPIRVLEEAYRILRPGGFVFLVTPNIANPLYFPVILIPTASREKLLRSVGDHPDHEYLTYLRANSLRRLNKLAARTGFELRRFKLMWEDHYVGRLPIGNLILRALDKWGTGTQLENFAGRLYVLLTKAE